MSEKTVKMVAAAAAAWPIRFRTKCTEESMRGDKRSGKKPHFRMSANAGFNRFCILKYLCFVCNSHNEHSHTILIFFFFKFYSIRCVF